MVLRYKYQPDKRSGTYMKNVLIVTPVRLELTARGLTKTTTAFAANFRL